MFWRWRTRQLKPQPRISNLTVHRMSAMFLRPSARMRTRSSPRPRTVGPESKRAPHFPLQATLVSNDSQKSVVHAGYRRPRSFYAL